MPPKPSQLSPLPDTNTLCECGRVAVVVLDARIGVRRNIVIRLSLCSLCAAVEQNLDVDPYDCLPLAPV